jgi:hypothetical protein
MSGSNISGLSGVYGEKGVPNPDNFPGGRSGPAVSWMDNSGNMWLFGGSGHGAGSGGGNTIHVNHKWHQL